ncbi:hypothetical protein KIN20_028555 [Parelaphostrongylus tenuis]|uniref:Uncharacterized protein n=1 Tax=Parelaphostrongylus tenuis TaxID=148309 RepID=A0AAD5WEX1_PARTN|nr:hypothetical protein KIN20_028555 [Parelaphostrongylus tenuis]
MFTHHPDLRRYFKGAESYTADDVQKSERDGPSDLEANRLAVPMSENSVVDMIDTDNTALKKFSRFSEKTAKFIVGGV